MEDMEGEHGDGGLGSQGMHTSYTYHLREGKRAQRGVPGADGGKRRSYRIRAALRQPRARTRHSLIAHPGNPPVISLFTGWGVG